MGFADNSQELSDFIEVLLSAEVVSEDEVKDVLRQPYKYQEVYDAWKEAGYPLADSGEDWDNFVESLETEEETEEE